MRKPLILLSILLFAGSAFAAAGGGGGGSSGDGGDAGDLFWIVYYIFRLVMMLPFPLNLIVLGLIVIGIFYLSRKYKNISGLNNIPSFSTYGNNQTAARTDKIPQEFMARNPDFNNEDFKIKVRKAFVQIQEAWMKQELSSVRRWISDGIYQRFNTQFIMMKQTGQVNEISDIQIHQVFVDDVEADGNYDILHVGIQYSMYDAFTSSKFPQLSEGGPLHALEYWSFIKRSGVKEKDLYSSSNCPNCGGDLPKDGGETAKCPYCDTITYLGDYDWVLAEITQPDDYLNSNAKYGKQGKFSKQIRAHIGSKTDFSLQLLEDKASNGYMQMMTSLSRKRPEISRRFVSDNLYEKLSQQIASESGFVFNRLYLNHVTSFDYFKENEKDNVVIALKRSSQQIKNFDKAPQFDRGVFSQDEILVMSRDANAGTPKGSLYAHSCPNCGAPVKDTIDINCSYCGAQLNSTKYEWIISDWMPAHEYSAYRKAKESSFVINKEVDALEELFEVRDYALNNVLLMVAADGKISEEEVQFVTGLAKKWNYDTDKIQGFLMLARNNKLVVRMPQNAKHKEKIVALMEKAASFETITAEEKSLLESVRQL